MSDHRDADGRLHRHVRPAQGGPRAPHRPRQLRRQPERPRAWSGWPSCAARTRTRGSRSVDLKAARAAEGVVAAYSGDDLAGDFAGPLPCAWPVTEDIKAPAALAARPRQGALRRRRRRGRRRREPRRREGRGRARRGRLRAAAGRHRRRGRGRDGAPARPRRLRHERLLRLEARRPARSSSASPTPP